MKSFASQNKQSKQALTPALPEVAYSLRGIRFNPNEDLWSWVDGVFRVRLDFSRLSIATTFPVTSLKYTLHVFVKGNAPKYVVNLFNAFVHFLSLRKKQPALVFISVAEVSNYAARLQDHEKWKLVTLNALLQKWHELGLPGIDAECAQYLRERRKPGNVKGTAVRQQDPVSGSFTDEEDLAIYKAVDAAYGRGEAPFWFLVLYRLLRAAGGRISQYASLKVKDIGAVNGEFVFRLPQAKTGQEHSRESFREYDLSPQTGRLVMTFLQSRSGEEWNDDSPMFHVAEVLIRGPREQLRSTEDMFYGHCTSEQLSSTFTRIMSRFAPVTSRLDFEQIPVNPKRFRPSFGTRLVDEGASMAVVAHLLGHADLQNVAVYFEQTRKGFENMDKAMGPQLAPVARCFQGRLIEGKEDATQKNELGSVIIDFRVSSKSLASCTATPGSCAFSKPVACYTCFRFEPWLDGPHEAVLARLEQDRAKRSSDPRFAAINDASIIAVKEVIAECAMVRKQQAEGTPP